ncbi:MAG: hypothetical protein ACLUEK_16145 [Oscillospiraceae bacterium]
MPFNEGWGQFDAERCAAAILEIDATRTADHASVGPGHRRYKEPASTSTTIATPGQKGRCVVLSSSAATPGLRRPRL